VTVKKRMFRKETLSLVLDLGIHKSETTEMEVENPNEWRKAIVSVASQI
jgi:hypothetical protein